MGLSVSIGSRLFSKVAWMNWRRHCQQQQYTHRSSFKRDGYNDINLTRSVTLLKIFLLNVKTCKRALHTKPLKLVNRKVCTFIIQFKVRLKQKTVIARLPVNCVKNTNQRF